MPSDDELYQKLKAYHKSEAKCNAYNDLCDLLKKYEEKINRQVNEASRKYEAFQKGGAKSSTCLDAISKENVLRYQLTEVKDLRLEFLNRSIDLMHDLKAKKDEYIACLKEITEEEKAKFESNEKAIEQ